jgi:hypothetical protein
MKIQTAIITIAIVIMVIASVTTFGTFSFAVRTNGTGTGTGTQHNTSTASSSSPPSFTPSKIITTTNPVAHNATTTLLQCSSKDENDVGFLWKHVYAVDNGQPWGRQPGRLTPQHPDCVAVTGTVYSISGKGTFDDPDGDLQFTLALDQPYTKYSAPNDCRPSNKNCTNIIVEVICHKTPDPTYVNKWGGYCKGVNSVYHPGQFPKQGDKLTVYGKFVVDTDGGWNEIHPASYIH